MQPNTQQPTPQQEGFYRPAQASAYQTAPVAGGSVEAPVYDSQEVVNWNASEYIHRSKDAAWIASFIGVVVAFVAVSVWLRAWTFTALVIAMAIAMGVFAFRQPKTKHYTLSHQGLRVDDKLYNLDDFRSFGVMSEEAFYSIILIPVKRFMPALTVYFAQEDGEKIVDILGSHLPLEELQPDPIDALMRRLHF